MTAKEMFEALGYDKYIHYDNIKRFKEIEIYYANEGKEDVNKIWFILETKTYIVRPLFKAHEEITPRLHKAITQQMKELGWLE